MQRRTMTEPREERRKELYHEPLLIKHEPLRDITGQKYNEEKVGAEKIGGEKLSTEKQLVEVD